MTFLCAYESHAFGIATPYFPNDTIMLEPGQSFDYTIKVQNNEDISFDVAIEYESDENIAFLNSTNFFIPEKSYENEFTFIITIPNISTIGTTYYLNYAAKPSINMTGQVPMNVEIRKTAYFTVVESGGQGYYASTPSNTDKILNSIISVIKHSYVYAIIIIVLATIIFVGLRLWKLSSKITDASTIQKAPYTISESKSVQELTVLIRMMNNKQFDNEFIRNLYSEKFKELNENFLSTKVLIASRKEMLEMLK
ncbi:MAG: hypothetical protein ACP5NV_01280 [Candidatus Woesearchaeota archaeon]